jgi:hypothetical protein
MDARPLPDKQPARLAPLTTDEIASYVVTAVWAPSVHNTQPWHFTADGQQISLHADAGRQLHVTDPDGRDWLRESIRIQMSDGAYPQLILRLGTVIQAATSVRRAPDDVLSASDSEHLCISNE